MQTEFPKDNSQYLRAKDFQDNPTRLTYLGWDYKGNEDLKDKNGKITQSWEDRLQYMRKWSYPEMAFNPKNGQPMLDKDGKPIRNQNFKPEFPMGYTFVYFFEEGRLECNSEPLWQEFKRKNPSPKQVITLKRFGEKMSTDWEIKKHGEETGFPEIQVDRPSQVDSKPDALESLTDEIRSTEAPF